MSRSLAFVGILAITGVGGPSAVQAQENATQTSQGVVVKNHMSDAERDRLMKEAMEKARRKLDQQKAEKEAALEKAAEEQEKREAADAKAEAAQKAEEERLAKQLAEEEKARDSESADRELKPLSPADMAQKKLEKEADKAETESVAKENDSDSDSNTEKEKKSIAKSKASEDEVDKSEEKKTASADDSSEDDNDEPTDLDEVKKAEKTVIETVSTNAPGEGLTVKTSMPVGDEARKAEQRAAMSGLRQREQASDNDRDGDETTLNGRVVGVMRSSASSPRILVQDDHRRMVQVVLEKGGNMPAPGARVTIKGREIGSGGARVVSAYSVTISSGSTRVSSTAPRRGPMPLAPPVPALPPPPPLAIHMPLPMGPMLPPPPPPF